MESIREQASRVHGVEDIPGDYTGAFAEPEPTIEENTPVNESVIDLSGFFDFLKNRQTGEGKVKDYTDHPMNYDGKISTGFIIRGGTGIVDNDLNSAVIDILIGIVMKVAERLKLWGSK